MNQYLVIFILSCIAGLVKSNPFSPFFNFDSFGNPRQWESEGVYNPEHRTNALCRACPETRPAPSTVSKKGMISKGKLVVIPDSAEMLDQCGPVFFSGNTKIFRVPDVCCTASVGAEDFLNFKDFGSHDGIEGCSAVGPSIGLPITAVLANGCYDDGTQFYGEKCGGSDFGEDNVLAHGDCGPTSPKQGSCACNLYVETKSPGCFAIGTPNSVKPKAVFLRLEGCVEA